MDGHRNKAPVGALKEEPPNISTSSGAASDAGLSDSLYTPNLNPSQPVVGAADRVGVNASMLSNKVPPKDSATSRGSPATVDHRAGSYGKISRGGSNPKTAWLNEPKQPLLEQDTKENMAKKVIESKPIIFEDDGFPQGWDKYDAEMRDQQFNYWISEDARNKASADARPTYTIPPDEAFAEPDQDGNLSATDAPPSPSVRDELRDYIGRPTRRDSYSFMNAKALKQQLQNRGLFNEYSFQRTTAATDYNDAREALRNDDANTRRTQLYKAVEASWQEQLRYEDEAARIQQEEDERIRKTSAEAYWKRQEERAEKTRQKKHELAEAPKASKETKQQNQKQAPTHSDSQTSKAPPKKGTLLSQLLSEIDPSKASIPPSSQTQSSTPASTGPTKVSRNVSANRIPDIKTKPDKRTDSSGALPTSNTASYARSTKASEARRNNLVPAPAKSDATRPPKKISIQPPIPHTAGHAMASANIGNRLPKATLASNSRKNSTPSTGSGKAPQSLKPRKATLKPDTEPERTVKPAHRLTAETRREQEAAIAEVERLTETKRVEDTKRKGKETRGIARAVTSTRNAKSDDGEEINEVKDHGSEASSSHDRKQKHQLKRKQSDRSDQIEDGNTRIKRQRTLREEDGSISAFNHDREHKTQSKRKRSDSTTQHEDGHVRSKRQRTHREESGTDGESDSESSPSHEHNKQLKSRQSDSSGPAYDCYTHNKRQRTDSEEDELRVADNSQHKCPQTKRRKKYNKPWRNPFINL